VDSPNWSTGAEVGVVGIADAERVGWDAGMPGDPKSGGDIVGFASPDFDYGDVGGVVAE
jgi:hypothetical protein